MSATHLSRRAFTRAAAGTGIALLLPPVPARGQSPSPLPSDPMQAAEELSRLEATEHIPALYTFYALMHPDAQAIIPRHVVIGWYREEFQPRGPEPAKATGVDYKDWEWAVNGTTYRDAAEVSYTQAFADGTTTDDVVHLVEHDGAWRWFFGRDRAWVDEQIDRFTQTRHVPFAGEAPYNLAEVALADDMLDRLPETIELERTTMKQDAMAAVSPVIPEWATGTDVRRYIDTGEPYPLGYAQVFRLGPGMTPADAIRRAIEDYETAPPFTLDAWNLSPENDTPFAAFETFGSDAVGMAQNVMWASARGDLVGLISCVDEAGLEAMAKALNAG